MSLSRQRRFRAAHKNNEYPPIHFAVLQSDQGMQCKAKSGEKAEFTCGK
jgi:hypothetical protein